MIGEDREKAVWDRGEFQIEIREVEGGWRFQVTEPEGSTNITSGTWGDRDECIKSAIRVCDGIRTWG